MIREIRVLLERKKDGNVIGMKHASSGQLALISSLLFLATNAGDDPLILIDEPENSLHPSWQREYIEKVLAAMNFRNASIIVATHAPLIVTGALTSNPDLVSVFQIRDGVSKHLLMEKDDRSSYMKINGKIHYLWRAVDHGGEVLECYVSKRRNRKAALKFLRKLLKRHGQSDVITTDKLPSYGAAMKEIGNLSRQDTGHWKNNRAENSHQPFRRRERAMHGFRSEQSLQKFVSVHFSTHSHFNQQRHLVSITDFKKNRDAVMNEWRQLLAV